MQIIQDIIIIRIPAFNIRKIIKDPVVGNAMVTNKIIDLVKKECLMFISLILDKLK